MTLVLTGFAQCGHRYEHGGRCGEPQGHAELHRDSHVAWHDDAGKSVEELGLGHQLLVDPDEQGTLELCQMYVAVCDEITRRTGMTPERFMAGMRELLKEAT